MKLFKKGSDKPIEIFVSLFLILAVAMVLLKMFSGQVADKGNELSEYSEKQTAIATCEQSCSDVKANKCRPEDQIRFCTKKFSLDYNHDSVLGVNDDDFTFPFCEDSIYCPIVTDCSCGVDLTFANCKIIMQRYYKSDGINLGEAQINQTIKQKYNYTNGEGIGCVNPTVGSNDWYSKFIKIY